MSDWKVIEEKVAFTSIHWILLFSERSHQLHNSVNISAMKLSQEGTEIRHILLLPVQLNTNYEYIEPKAEKQKIQCLVTKRGKKFNPTRFSESWSLYFGWFHLLFFSHDHFVQPKAEKKQNTVFGYKKGWKVQSDKIFWSATSKLWVVSFSTFDSWPFYQAKSWKTQNTVFGYKKG